MAKAKAKVKVKANPTIPYKNVYSRMSYLYQAATYLSNATEQDSPAPMQTNSKLKEDDRTSGDEPSESQRSQAKFLLNQIRGVTRKAQVRLRPELKRTICKRCDALLIPGQTSTVMVENASRNGHKAWADVLVIKCNDCQSIKRFPVGQTQKTKRPDTGVKLDTQD